MANKNSSIKVKGTAVKIKTVGSDDFICLTDIAKSKNPEHPDDLIRNWLRNRNTLELLRIWEQLHNLDFNPVEFDGIRKQAGLNSFTLTPKQWIEQVNAIGIQSKAGEL
ncbi:MAG: KilA-N domain-containing protein [Verrucomicrobia bacterium]|nr:KilA-N domain-containing protein [Verrucomicrobiota bacterium]